MTNNNQYIILRYTDTDHLNYEIYIKDGEQKRRLKPYFQKIMYDILKQYPNKAIDSNTYIYTNYNEIILKYERIKTKLKKKKVNRPKSRLIIPSIILATTLFVGGLMIHKNSNKLVKEEPAITVTIATEPYTEAPTELLEDINQFYYEFNTPNDKEALINAEKYIEVFKKYEKIYGVDATLLCAIGAQESSGIHHEKSINGGYAIGIMGIENVWANANIKVFNFDTNSYETITVDYSKIGDLDYNVKVGAAIFQNYFYNTIRNNPNMDSSEILAFTLQKYNMGPGNMNKLLKMDGEWQDNRELIKAGDNLYIEHVLSRLPNYEVITIKQPNGTNFNTSITNTALINTYSRT